MGPSVGRIPAAGFGAYENMPERKGAGERARSGANSDSTPAVSYLYDQTSYNGLTITNGKARRTGMGDGSGQTAHI